MEKIKLHFHCNQEPENMPVAQDGRPFCTHCTKALVDFRDWPLQEVKEYTDQHQCCGIFAIQHVQEEYTSILSSAALKKMMLTVTTFFALETASAQTNQEVLKPVENVDSTIKPGSSIINQQPGIASAEVQSAGTQKTCRSSLYRTEYGLFVRKKFPFITFKRKTSAFNSRKRSKEFATGMRVPSRAVPEKPKVKAISIFSRKADN